MSTCERTATALSTGRTVPAVARVVVIRVRESGITERGSGRGQTGNHPAVANAAGLYPLLCGSVFKSEKRR